MRFEVGCDPESIEFKEYWSGNGYDGNLDHLMNVVVKDPSQLIVWRENDKIVGHAIWHESNTEEHRKGGSPRNRDDREALEDMMKNFMKNMSKEDKQKMMQEFMNSMTEEERTEMMRLMMPIMMKSMKPSMMMPNMMKDFDENECQKMMMEMEPDMREKCRKMMAACLKASE